MPALLHCVCCCHWRLDFDCAELPPLRRYRSTVIEELAPEEGSPEHEEAVAHERAAAWQEEAHKAAMAAQGKAAAAARALVAERARVRCAALSARSVTGLLNFPAA